MTTRPAAAARSLGGLPWLVPLAMLGHMAEEWPRFPAWATSHFGTTSPRFYLLSHIPILAIVAWVSYRASRPAASPRSLWLLTMILAALGTNTLFHLGATVAFGEWAPGLATAIVLYIPLLFLLIPRTSIALGGPRARTAGLTGAVLSALIAMSLWLDMPT